MKIITTLKLFSALLLVALLSLSFTHNEVNDQTDWTLLKSELNIEVYGQITKCGDADVYLFMLKNTADRTQEVELQISISDDPSFGFKKFLNNIPGNGKTPSNCAETKLSLPRMGQDSNLEKAIIKLTIK